MAKMPLPLARQRKGRLHTTDPAPHLASYADDDDAEHESARSPIRRCIVTRETGERARMLRFVLSPDRTILPDLSARLPGRGFWLSARRDVLEAGRKKGLASAFARATRGPVVVPPDLIDMVRAGLAARVGEQIGLARRAGQAVAGFAKTREWLLAGRVGLVVQASDGSEDERRRLVSGAAGVPVAWPLDGLALGSLFGRDHTVHVAVAPGQLARKVFIECERLAGVSGTTMTRYCEADATIKTVL